MSKRIAYLSGPMSGYPEYNYPAFARTARHLRATGWDLRSPHECEPEPDRDNLEPHILWERMMEKCMEMMKECNSIILMEGWVNSRGAMLEFQYALQSEFDVFYYHELNDQIIRMSRPR